MKIGESVVEMPAKDLQAAFSERSGFSAFNLWRMRQFYTAYTSRSISGTACARMTGGHSVGSPCGIAKAS